MFVQKVRSEGTSHISYFIGAGHEAAVVDPRRDVEEYLELAGSSELSIKYVLETHRNEDYVSGSAELAAATGAKILHGGQIPFGYGSEVRDGDVIGLGSSVIKAIHTPGHTPESFSYVLYDIANPSHPLMVFCGDVIFAGDVGRTDLNGTNARERSAGELFDSITKKLLPLGPSTILCPAHGAGSICGVHIADREDTTIGTELALNMMLNMGREDFISWKKMEELEISPIFKRMEMVNLAGARPIGAVHIADAMLPKEIKRAIVKGALILDVRKPHHYSASHVPGSINLYSDFIPTYGAYVIPTSKPVVLVADCASQVESAYRLLLRSGYDRPLGHLRGGMESWMKGGNESSRLETISAKGLMSRITGGEETFLLDVRDNKEISQGTIPGAKMVHLGKVQERIADIPKSKVAVAFCGSGPRGSCAASILLRNGFTKVMNLSGGFEAWKASGYEITK
ncbi:MAG: MBL fold metallo-hydrolase [Euryarchaeota archaeon]|nr:MBL fold metallo-hydrolase [Euryarchaeota archaeon]